MIKAIITIFLSFSLSLIAFSQTNLHFGGRSAAMAHASVTLSDVWSSHHNQAGLAWLEEKNIGIYYQNRFSVSQLSNFGIAYANPLKKGTFALQWSNFGFQQYQENKIGLAYAMQLHEKLALGIQIDYMNTRLGGIYGSKSTLAGELGLQAKLTSKMTLGLHVFNPTRAKLNDYNQEAVPTIMRLGMGYYFSEKVLVTVETEKDIIHPASLKTGVEYLVNEKLSIRGGIGTGPSLMAFGFGLNNKNYKLNVATNFHQTLGFSPELSFIYQFKKQQ